MRVSNPARAPGPNILLTWRLLERLSTTDNSFIVPTVQMVWAKEGPARDAIAQMIISLLLLPYQFATSFFGMSGAGAAADVAAELEGAMVDMAGADGQEKEEEEEEEEEEGEASPLYRTAKERWNKAAKAAKATKALQIEDDEQPRASASKGQVKRLKREAFLARVRGRMQSKAISVVPGAAQSDVVEEPTPKQAEEGISAQTAELSSSMNAQPQPNMLAMKALLLSDPSKCTGDESVVSPKGDHFTTQSSPRPRFLAPIVRRSSSPSSHTPNSMAPLIMGPRHEQLKEAFATFDADGSGSLNAVELSAILSKGGSLSKADALEKAKAVIAKYDFDGNGELDVRLTRRSNSQHAMGIPARACCIQRVPVCA